tara:strand:+ start:858 stop:1106 length:249 start_codon:yes stop_codon:yes gene_type:complete
MRETGSLSKSKEKQRGRGGHVPVMSQTFVIGKSLELAVHSPDERAKSGGAPSRSPDRGGGSVQSIRSLEPSPKSKTGHMVKR